MSNLSLAWRARMVALASLLAAAAAAVAQEPPGAPRPGTGGLFEEMPVVEAASLHTQTLQEAPANVTIITDEDIRKYGYRTLGAALAGARGFYLTADHVYEYVGLRGFSLPGDLNTRFLVMIDGHAMTDIIYNQNGFFGQDFGLDMDLVKRIEIIRGPASALYGSNGIFCTVNIVTKAPVEHPGGRVSVETDSFGERKMQAASSLNLGRGANLLLSVSAFNNSGQTLYYPEFDTPQTGNGWASGVDGERGYHAFAHLVWHNWSLVANLSTREKNAPVVPWATTLFADRGNKLRDGHDFVEARYSRDFGASYRLQWRIYYDRYQFKGRYDYPDGSGGIEDVREYSQGDWVGSQVTFRRQWSRFGASTVGAEFIGEARNLQGTDIASPVQENIASIEKRDFRGSVFGQQELDLSRRWKVDVGLRYDRSYRYGAALSPRAALLFRQSPATVYKFLWGRAFRNPTAFEAYWTAQGESQVPNPGLQPEHADTWEASWERLVDRRINLVATAYRYDLRGLIQAVPVDGGGILYQYRNVSESRAYGAEFEVHGRFSERVEGGASFAIERTEDPGLNMVLPNSPGRVAKVRLSVPVWRRKLFLASDWQYLSARSTLAGSRLPGVAVGELHASTVGLNPNFDFQFGVCNLLDHRYDDPVGGFVIDQIRADGRSVYLKLIWHTRD